MAQTRKCPKCSGAMREGFVLDATHGGLAVSSWVEGAPQRSAWTGLKLRGRARSQISAWRCERCGFVEHYAPATPDGSLEAAERKQIHLALGITVGALVAILGAALILR